MKVQTKKLAILGMLSALAYILMVFLRIPVVLFLKYEPKDIVIAIGGFIYGPLASFAMSVTVSFIEMATVSDTGIIGAVMNIISTCSFACTASYIYKRRHTLNGAVIGLISGWLLTTVVMLLWNYLMVPIYTPNIPREKIAEMLLPAFLPFNLLKGGLNAALTMLVYKPVRRALSAAHMLPESPGTPVVSSKINAGVVIVSLFIIATCVMLILVLQGKI